MDRDNEPQICGVGDVTYCLVEDKDESGITCYNLLVRAGEEECCLTDIGRTYDSAARLRDMLAGGQVTPHAVHEVVEELLARDPNLFC